MQHKSNIKLSHNIKQSVKDAQQVQNFANITSSINQTHELKNFLKSNVRRPEVTPDFIQHIRKNIHQK